MDKINLLSKKKNLVWVLIFLVLMICEVGFISATCGNWIEQNSSKQDWSGVASSSDGIKLVASAYNNYIYISNDSGVTWIQKFFSTTDWMNVASSSDGSVLYAVSYSGGAYVSTNGGDNWNVIVTSPFLTVATSSNGSVFAMGVDGDQIVLSTDYGFNIYVSGISGSWLHLDMSSDGTKIVATNFNGDIYISNDTGITWRDITDLGSNSWVGIAMSSDGTKIATATNLGSIYISNDSGVTWANYSYANLSYINGLSASKDFSKIGLWEATGNLFILNSSGNLEIESQAGLQDWSSMAFSDNGKKIVAGGYSDTNGTIWTYEDCCIPNWIPYNSTCFNNSKTLNYFDNNSCGSNSSLPFDNGTIYYNSCGVCIPSPINLVVLNYPYVDLNTSYNLILSSPVNSGYPISIYITNLSGSVLPFNFSYVSGHYEIDLSFSTIGDYNFVINSSDSCISGSLSGTFLVRNPFYITVNGFKDKNNDSYINNFAYMIAQISGNSINPTLEQFTPVLNSNVFHAQYSNGQAILKIYEPNKYYLLRLVDGQITFPNTYSIPNVSKSYGINAYLGRYYFNGSDETLNIYLTEKDLHPYSWLLNWGFIIFLISCAIITMIMFFIIPDRPWVAMSFGFGTIGLSIMIRVGIWFFTGS